MDIDQLKALDAVFLGETSAEETYKAMLPHVAAYMQARAKLGELSLGQVRNALIMAAGGRR